jgi:hypothetical protein
MSHLLCAVDENGEIKKGSLGFYSKEDLQVNFPSDTIVEFDTDKFPVDFECYRVINKKFVKKNSTEISAIDAAKLEALKPAKYDEFMALDVSKETPAVKLMYEFLKGVHGLS